MATKPLAWLLMLVDGCALGGIREGQDRGQLVLTVVMGSRVQAPTDRVGPLTQPCQAATNG